MRRVIFKLLLLIIVTALVAEGLSRDPGYIFVQYQSWAIESSVSVLCFTLIAISILIILLCQLIKPLSMTRDWFVQRKSSHQDEARSYGWQLLAEGEYQKAEASLAAVADTSDQPLAYFLGAAQAADALGEKEKRSSYLSQAAKNCKKDSQKIAVGLAQAQIQFNGKEWESCLATLLSILPKSPKHKLILKLLFKTYQKLEDWQELKALLPKLKKYEILPHKDIEMLAKQIYQGLLNKLTKLEPPEERLVALTNLWKTIPGTYKSQPDLNQCYIEQLIKIGREDLASAEIEKSLKNARSDALFTLYSQLTFDNLEQRWNHLNKWLAETPSNATLQLALGRVALQRNDWSKAKMHFEKSVSLKPTSEGFLELARLSANLGEKKSSNQHQEKGLALLNAQLPVLPQPAD